MDIQRLRNLTTGRIHTTIDHFYEDLEMLTGEKGLMSHMLPRAMRAVEPWLRDNVEDQKFWDGEFDAKHTGEIDLPMPNKEDQEIFFERFAAMPNPLNLQLTRNREVEVMKEKNKNQDIQTTEGKVVSVDVLVIRQTLQREIEAMEAAAYAAAERDGFSYGLVCFSS